MNRDSDFGITPQERERFAAIAAIEDEQVKEYIAACRKSGEQVTSNGALRFAAHASMNTRGSERAMNGGGMDVEQDVKIGRNKRSVGKVTRESESTDLQLEREDWTRFRTLDGCCARAGVPRDDLAKLVAKELVDNALDAASEVEIGFLENGRGLFVEDNGPGLGEPKAVARLFSIRRPMVSSKLWRRPTRGALGNGLRVVAGVVLASGGRLVVHTNGRSLEVVPRKDGHSDVTVLGEWDGQGTRVEVEFGSSIDVYLDALDWAKLACWLSGGTSYSGRPNAWCFGADAFAELCSTAADWSVRRFVECFDGCSGRRASQIAGPWLNRKLGELDSNDVSALHDGLLGAAPAIKPRRLGTVGRFDGWKHRRASGSYARDGAWIPYCVEVWARAANDTTITTAVNRTQVAGDGLHCSQKHNKALLEVWGLGLDDEVTAPKRPFELIVNVTSPYLPMTTDGKAPDLSPVAEPMLEAIRLATYAATRSSSRPREATHKDLVLAGLNKAISFTSSDGEYQFRQRQLFYTVRQDEDRLSSLSWGNFCKIITDLEGRERDIPGMIRDDRGTLYHPHRGQLLSLGDTMVLGYERPRLNYNKVLYIEKEGPFDFLIKAKWPERHDCALLTSKGQPTRAARDFVDLLGDGDEPCTFFCVHDADAAGTVIFQTLTKATAARGARKVHVRNLGLEVAEALKMGLAVETVEHDRRQGVGQYVGPEEADWLQTHRVELNAMRPEELIAWLDEKMRRESGKIVPRKSVIVGEAEAKLEQRVRVRVHAQILEENHAADRVADEFERLRPQLERKPMVKIVRGALDESPELSWREPVDDVVADIMDGSER